MPKIIVEYNYGGFDNNSYFYSHNLLILILTWNLLIGGTSRYVSVVSS